MRFSHPKRDHYDLVAYRIRRINSRVGYRVYRADGTVVGTRLVLRRAKRLALDDLYTRLRDVDRLNDMVNDVFDCPVGERERLT